MKKNELPKEINEYMDEYIKTHTIKNMDDMQEMMRNLFGPALQKMLSTHSVTFRSLFGHSKYKILIFKQKKTNYKGSNKYQSGADWQN